MSGSRLTPPVGPEDHAAGSANAPVTLVEYGDFECPYCGQAYPIVKELEERLGDRLRVVFRNFPLSEAHPHAQHAAEAAEAAGAQGRFWEMHDALYEHQDALGDRALIGYAAELGIDEARVARELESGTYAGEVRADFRGGVRSGVNGTPTFFINGERYDGSWGDVDGFARVLSDVAKTTAGRRR
jgi:protein-disulfide isomerase